MEWTQDMNDETLDVVIVNEIEATLKLIEKNLVIEYERILGIPITEDVMPEKDIPSIEYLNSIPREEWEDRKRNIERLMSHISSLPDKEHLFPYFFSFLEHNLSIKDLNDISRLNAFISRMIENNFDK